MRVVVRADELGDPHEEWQTSSRALFPARNGAVGAESSSGHAEQAFRATRSDPCRAHKRRIGSSRCHPSELAGAPTKPAAR